MSYTSMNLHYSQTQLRAISTTSLSYTSMNLHYSQTYGRVTTSRPRSYTSMNLHYSQTCKVMYIAQIHVLYLYEFTLLSNQICTHMCYQQSYTSMNLHYSQTSNFENPACNWYVNPHLCYTFLYNKYQHISF